MPVVNFINPIGSPLKIIVQSLHQEEVRVGQIEFLDFPNGINHNNYFEFVDLPPEAMDLMNISTNGVFLSFGEKLPFHVRLTNEGSVYVQEHAIAWCFISMIVADQSGNRVEHLKVQAIKEPS